MDPQKEILRRIERLEEGQKSIRLMIFLASGLILSGSCMASGEGLVKFLFLTQAALLLWLCLRGRFS